MKWIFLSLMIGGFAMADNKLVVTVDSFGGVPCRLALGCHYRVLAT